MIEARYRRDYSGEFLVTETRWVGGTKQQKREWIPNNIENHHISGRAAIILSDFDRSRFNYTRLQRHRGGLLGKKRLQTYGCGAIWQHLVLDFWVGKERSDVDGIIAQRYDERSTVYTYHRHRTWIARPWQCIWPRLTGTRRSSCWAHIKNWIGSPRPLWPVSDRSCRPTTQYSSS